MIKREFDSQCQPVHFFNDLFLFFITTLNYLVINLGFGGHKETHKHYSNCHELIIDFLKLVANKLKQIANLRQ